MNNKTFGICGLAWINSSKLLLFNSCALFPTNFPKYYIIYLVSILPSYFIGGSGSVVYMLYVG